MSAPLPAPRRRLDLAWRLSLLVALLYLALCVLGAIQTGSSWDEGEHRIYGKITLDFYRTLGADRTATTYWTNYYGALHALVGELFERLLFFAPWTIARHMGSVAFAFVGFVYSIRLARLLAGPWAGFVAALLLATTPRWTGDAMFNPVDIPTAGMHAVALFYLARLVGSFESARLRDWLKLGLAAGLTLSVRAIGLLILPYAGLGLVLWWLGKPEEMSSKLRTYGSRHTIGFVLALALQLSVTLALWPRALVEPMVTLNETLGRTNSYPWPGAVLFRGAYVNGHELPPTYLLVWFSITTPLAVLLGLALAPLFRSWLPRERGPLVRAAVLAYAVLFPPAYATLKRVVIYDGIRHFLFLLPPLAVLAAVGWTALLARAAKLGRTAQLAGATLLAALVAEPVVWYARSHPYEYTYFNPLVGGLAGASHGYDTDYWGLTLRSAAETLKEHRLELLGPEGHLTVMTNAPWHLIEPWLDDPTKYSRITNDQADQPHQILLLWYRTMPVGWEKDPPPVRRKVVVEGQAPFWQTYYTSALPRRSG